MTSTRARVGAHVLCASLALIGCVSCGSGSPSGSADPDETTNTENRVGTVSAHQLGYVNFSMARAGLVSLRVEPTLLLTLRSGKAPEEFGDFITNSDSGSLTMAAPSGVNSVVVGNPFDRDHPFTLTITHP